MPDAGGGDDQGGGAPPPAAMEAPEEADVAPTPKPRKASVDRSLDVSAMHACMHAMRLPHAHVCLRLA